MKVKDLPSSDRTHTTLPNGGTLEGVPTFLYCRRCGAQYSATRGDYFAAHPDTVLRCCGEPMVLARTTTTIHAV